MATRAQQIIDHAVIRPRTVETGQSVARYRIVKDGNVDGECQHAAAGEAGMGVSLYIGGNPTVTAGAAGDYVDVIMATSGGIAKVLVGTGGATRGLLAKCVADGVTDATPDLAGGATQVYAVGQFVESGVAGDVVGMQLSTPTPILE